MDANTLNEFAWEYLFSNPRLVALRLTADMRIQRAGLGCMAVLGYPPEELTGRELIELVIVDSGNELDDLVDSGSFEGEMIKLRSAFDREVTLFMSFFRTEDGAVLVGETVQQGSRLHSDITMELHKKAFSLAKSAEDLRRRNAYLELSNQRMRDNLVTDPTTGLYKRNLLEKMLKSEYERARRHGSHLCFMLVGVDGLRALRELQGGEAADRVMRGVGRVLETRKRIFDILGHFDADSFYVILPHTPLKGAKELGERLLSMLENREIQASDYPFHIFLSVGVTCYHTVDSPLKSHEEMIHATADGLMRAQMEGGNQLQVSTTPIAPLRVIP